MADTPIFITRGGRAGSSLLRDGLAGGRVAGPAFRRVGRFDVDTALQIFQPIVSALDMAHAGIVLRDFKPLNIFVPDDT